MLVPLDLYVLVQKMGRLTPPLVMGWRVGGYVRDTFTGLDGVRMVVAAGGDFLEGLRITLTESRFPLDVLESEDDMAYDAWAWHPPTGTLLEFTFSPERTAMDQRGASVSCEARRGDLFGRSIYGAALDRQISRLISEPLESLCRIEERFVRAPSHDNKESQTVRCRRCGTFVSRSELWYADNVPCCASCSEIPEAWRLNH